MDWLSFGNFWKCYVFREVTKGSSALEERALTDIDKSSPSLCHDLVW